MKEALPVVWEVQYRNNGTDPWQLLCDRDESLLAAQQRLAGCCRRSPKSPTEYRIVKVTRELEAFSMSGEGSCSWCHTMNPIEARHCRKCGHEAHVARRVCQCVYCQAVRQRARHTRKKQG